MTQPLPRLLCTTVALLCVLAGRPDGACGSESPVDVADRRQLFLDRHVIASLEGGASLRLHRPQPAGVALAFDKPWEGVYSGYATVIHDGAVYRMYYRGNPGGEADGNELETTCYAESRDGMSWTKPELGLFEVMGTAANNVVLAGQRPFAHNFTPFLDGRPGVPAAERYKAVAGIVPGGLAFFASADGVRWARMPGKSFNEPGRAFDSQNVAFWSRAEGRYVMYYRRFVGGVRSVARTTSADLADWSPAVLMNAVAEPPVEQEQLYTNGTHPYYRAPDVYVALAARFMEGRATLSAAQRAALRLDATSWLAHDCSDAVLMTARPGGDRYDRSFAAALVRPGLDAHNWVSRANYPALGVVPTGPGEMSIYVQRHYAQPTHHLERLTLRTDGFTSLSGPPAGGVLVTKLMTFTGTSLQVNYATSAAGSVRVEVQDAAGQLVPGFSAADCLPLTGDAIEQTVAWKSGPSLATLAGRPVRLRVTLKDADLYAFRFRT